jgi:hypothetical protein
MPNQPFKVCPNCGQPAVLSMPSCRRCGQSYPPFTHASAYGVHPDPRAAYGPRDRVELAFSLFWHWVGLYLSGAFLILLLRVLWENDQAGRTENNGYILLTLLLVTCLVNFCALRLRRLYVFYANEKRFWWIPAGVLGAVLGILLFVPLSPPEKPAVAVTERAVPYPVYIPSTPLPVARPYTSAPAFGYRTTAPAQVNIHSGYGAMPSPTPRPFVYPSDQQQINGGYRANLNGGIGGFGGGSSGGFQHD